MSSRSRHVILASFGTDGDVFPYAGLGAVLRRRGFDVTLASIPRYRALATRVGLSFEEISTKAEHDRILMHPDFWHPLKGAPLAAKWGLVLIPKQYALLAKLAAERPSVLVANPGVLAARILRERIGIPMASLVLQPGIIQSSHNPPVIWPTPLPVWAPLPIGDLYWRMVDLAGNLLLARDVNRFRHSLGVRRPVVRFFRWWMSPDRIIGLFPDWYGPIQPDWPRQIRLAGFGRFDGAAEKMTHNHDAWKTFCDAGDPPIAFTAGTGKRHAAAYFRAAVDACGRIGRRAILLTKFADQAPSPLPPTAIACHYAPFAELLPRCAALVHHGGIGTVAAAIEAGVPQLVTAISFDQPDNAARLKRLGLGQALPYVKVNAARLAERLSVVLRPEFRETCQALAQRTAGMNGFETAAGMVEELM
jgi:rhamnosyltransferase subunit B